MAARSTSEMDSLAEQIRKGLSLEAEETPASPAVYSMEDLVASATPSEMEVLRKQLLLQQKMSRFDDRGLVQKFLSAVQQQQHHQEPEDDITSGAGEQDQSSYSCFYNQIMLPVVVEKLEQLPSDFHQNWWCFPCPEGTRTLVIAVYNTTYAYDLEGNLICEHDTHLPGGSSAELSQVQDASECTILDCLYNDENETYYVVDVMCWAGYLLYKKETEVRLQFLTEKMKQTQSLRQVSQTNPFKFVMLPSSFSCNRQAISSVIKDARFELTGLLFYHKSAHYTPGVTPLGCWLEEYLIESMLNISTVQANFPNKGQRVNWKKNRYEESQAEEDYNMKVRNSAIAYRNSNNSSKGRRGQSSYGDWQQYDPSFTNSGLFRGAYSGYGGGYSGYGGFRPLHPLHGNYGYDYNYSNFYQGRGDRQGCESHQGQQRGWRKKKANQPPPKIQLSVPVPDEEPNWDEPHEVMMSVVMEKIPERFAEDWVCVVCPVAKRRTVVSCYGWTCSYNKLLAMDRKFQSALPGGNVRCQQYVRNQEMCILDCFHYKAERTFFVLDLMYWRNMPYYETEAEFRFHWIATKLAEVDAGTVGVHNEYKFRPMPQHQCVPEKIQAALQEVNFKVDGLLFFHKEGMYQIGITPNVLWLEPKDIERVLGFSPPERLLTKKTAAAPNASSSAVPASSSASNAASSAASGT